MRTSIGFVLYDQVKQAQDAIAQHGATAPASYVPSWMQNLPGASAPVVAPAPSTSTTLGPTASLRSPSSVATSSGDPCVSYERAKAAGASAAVLSALKNRCAASKLTEAAAPSMADESSSSSGSGPSPVLIAAGVAGAGLLGLLAFKLAKR